MKIRIAKDFKAPPPLTDEDCARIREESRACREAFEKATRGMESLTPEILMRKLR